MLPEDSTARKIAQVEAAALTQQTHINDHFKVLKLENKPTPNSDALFREAAIQWLVETDQVCLHRFWLYSSVTTSLQPIQAFEHPSFQNMIEIAARTTKGVKIPNRKQTRAQIVLMFKAQMHSLKAQLNVCYLYVVIGMSSILTHFIF